MPILAPSLGGTIVLHRLSTFRDMWKKRNLRGSLTQQPSVDHPLRVPGKGLRDLASLRQPRKLVEKARHTGNRGGFNLHRMDTGSSLGEHLHSGAGGDRRKGRGRGVTSPYLTSAPRKVFQSPECGGASEGARYGALPESHSGHGDGAMIPTQDPIGVLSRHRTASQET